MLKIGASTLKNTHTKESKMSDSKRSGYSIRADILNMAIGVLESRNSRQFDNEMLKEEVDREPVSPYSTEDVLVVAEKLYSFVENGSISQNLRNRVVFKDD